MIANGTIRFCLQSSEEEYDEDGLPIESDSEWSDDIEASIRAVTDERLVQYDDGTFHKQSYTIMIEEVDMQPEFYLSNAVKVTFPNGREREKMIATISPTPRMGRVTIIL